MKLAQILISIICLSAILHSCKKDDIIIPIEDDNVENIGLIGKWRFTESFDGYLFGSNSWNDIPWDYSHSLIFDENA